MENIDNIVEFERYCYKCKYYGLEEFREPCHECLNNPTNTNSRKPINFKEVETKDKKKDPVEKKESNIDIYSWNDEIKDFYKEGQPDEFWSKKDLKELGSDKEEK